MGCVSEYESIETHSDVNFIYATEDYTLEPTGLAWQTIPSISISYIDKRNDPAGKHGVLNTEGMFFVYNPLF